MEVTSIWKLDELYGDLARAKQVNVAKATKLTEVEQTIIKGLLNNHSPKTIAAEIHWTSGALSVELSRGLYRHIERMLDRPLNSLKTWRDVSVWLAEAGYKQEISSITEAETIDLTNIPEINSFYGRENELEKLESWLLQDKYRLIVLFGMAGIGKTTLAAQLSRKVAEKFTKVIWHNMSHAPQLTDLLTELLSYFEDDRFVPETRSIREQLSCLIGYLKQQSCLLVLDEYEAILATDNLMGFYQEEYKNYSQLLKYIAEGIHNSTLLITSRDETIDLSILRNKKADSLHLKSLGEAAKFLLQEWNLQGEDYYQELIDRYYGNPLALKLVANTIENLFARDVEKFLDRQTEFGAIVPSFFHNSFDILFKSLSILEKSIVSCLAQSRSPLTIDGIQKNLSDNIRTSELIEALTKLRRCSLIETVDGDKTISFTLQPIVGKYLLGEERKRSAQSNLSFAKID
jgi:deoxyadenosine/deoxycytidine kinase